MKLVTFSTKFATTPTAGVLIDNEIVDLAPFGYASILSLIQCGAPALADINAKLPNAPRIPFETVTLHAPIPRPPRIFGIGLNYQKHADESKMSVQKVPTVFMKLSSSVTGPDHPIILPKISEQPDYEAEFAVVISKPGYQIAAEDWYHHVFGYTIVNDVTARDLQGRHKQWLIGKSQDSFCPMGPWLVSADEIDLGNTSVRCWVNGELRQDANTKALIFDVPTLIETLSKGLTLLPGDIIATGTPAGVGIGFNPPKYLRAGDVVRIEIAGIGVLENPVAAFREAA